MKTVTILFLVFVTVSSFPADVSDSGENSEERPAFFIPTVRRPTIARFNPSVVEVDVGADSDADEDEAFFSSFFRPLFVNPFAGVRFPDFFSRPDSWFDRISPKVTPGAEVKNATSTTKIVDGHKVIVNDTTYEDEKTGAIFKFHSIQIFPVDSKEGTDSKEDASPETSTELVNRVNTEETEIKNVTPEETSSSKPDNNSADNEINREELAEQLPEDEKLQDNASSPVEVFEVFNENEEPQKYTDLSGDIKVNQLLADHGQQLVVIPEDVELLPESIRLTEIQNAQSIISTDDEQKAQMPIDFSLWQTADN